MERTFYTVQVDRSTLAARLSEHYKETGLPPSFVRREGPYDEESVRPSAMRYRAELTIFNSEAGLSRTDDIEKLLRKEGLRHANHYEGIEFGLAHRRAFLAALPMNMLGTVIYFRKIPFGRTRCAPAFETNGRGGVFMTTVRSANFWGAVNFLAAKL